VARKISITMAMLLALVLFAAVLLRGLGVRPAPRPAELPTIPGAESHLARLTLDSTGGALEVVIGPVTLPAHTPGYRPPIQLVRLPAAGGFHGYSWRMTDARGRDLPEDLLHHVNLIDPDEQDLFSGVPRRVFAAGRETPARRFTPLVGYPLAAGTRLLVVSMFSNPSPEPIDSAYLRIRLLWLPAGRALAPLPVFPFTLDVMGPVGEKSFPVPPGRTERSWEGSPRLDARILAIGGHLHDYARSLRLEDVTTGEILWEVEPVTQEGRLVAVPAGMPWKRGGIKLHRDRRYRVSVIYDNPTHGSAPHGGMGVVAGVAYVRQHWPVVRYDDPEYRQDLADIVAAPTRPAGAHGDHLH